ncbi:MAG: hypothetical protein R3B84_14260 [Zavarzinella sp.]
MRTRIPDAQVVQMVLPLAREIVHSGQTLLPLGVIADIAILAFGNANQVAKQAFPVIPQVENSLFREYEDYVLGKFYLDRSFERAVDAMRRFKQEERPRGFAYLMQQFCERAKITGMECVPGTLRTISDIPAAEFLQRGWDSLSNDGVVPEIPEQYRSLHLACRRMADLLAPEDIVALEHRTALADLGQYVAHRQIVQATQRFLERLPKQMVKPLHGRQEVPSKVFDEDAYPVGGFTSISTKGSIESLLHSQLAYMEKDEAMRPDMFDIKFVRDELYYYSRDENQFLRRHRSYIFVLHPELVESRRKDPQSPFQRIVLLLGFLNATVRQLADWLGNDALKFYFVFPLSQGENALALEAELIQMVCRELAEQNLVEIVPLRIHLSKFVENISEKSMCHLIGCSVQTELHADVEDVVETDLLLAGPVPTIHSGIRRLEITPTDPEDEPFAQWQSLLLKLLQVLV